MVTQEKLRFLGNQTWICWVLQCWQQEKKTRGGGSYGKARGWDKKRVGNSANAVLFLIKSVSSCSFVFWVLKVVFSIRVLLPFWMFYPNNVKNTLSESPWKGQGDSQFAKPNEWRSAMTNTMVDKYRSWIKEETTNLLKRYTVAIPSRSFNLRVWCVQHRSPMPPAFSSRTSLLPQHGCSRAMVGFCSQFACSVVGVHAFRKQRLVFFHTQLFLTGSKSIWSAIGVISRLMTPAPEGVYSENVMFFSLHKIRTRGKVKDQMEQSFRDNFQKVAEAPGWINMPGRLDPTAVWYSSTDVT